MTQQQKESHSLDAKPPIHQRFVVFLVTTAVIGLTMLYADIDVSFSSRLDAVNEQSTGAGMDTTFTFELGSFDPGFDPAANDPSTWMGSWNAVPGDSSAPYTQAPLNPVIAPNTGASNNFSGSVTLTDGSTPFSPADQPYIWGFDTRDGSGTAEWILLTNTDWDYPTVVTGVPQFGGPQFQTTDAGTTAVLGSVNPAFATLGDSPHLVSASVSLPPVPEPGSAALLLGPGTLLLLRRRR